MLQCSMAYSKDGKHRALICNPDFHQKLEAFKSVYGESTWDTITLDEFRNGVRIGVEVMKHVRS